MLPVHLDKGIIGKLAKLFHSRGQSLTFEKILKIDDDFMRFYPDEYFPAALMTKK